MKRALIVLWVLMAYASHAQVPAYVPTNGLKGYWPFCGNANDVSGNNANGTVSNAALTSDRFNIAGSAYNFNGTSSYISTTLTGVLGNNPRAVSFWARTTNAFSTMCGVSWGFEMSNPNYGVRWECAFNYGSTGATIIGADCAITYATPAPVNNNVWHHYVYQYNTGANWTFVQIYQDGILLTNVLHTHNPNAPINTMNNWPVNFGRIPYFIPHYFQGELDDIGIWDRVLTAAEIQALYQATGSSVSISASSSSICSGGSVSLTATGATSYTWNTSATTSMIVVSPTINTVYSVASNAGGCSGTQSIQVTVSPQPTVSVAATSASICAGETITLTASGANTYSWNTGPTSASISVSPIANSVYTVTGYGTNINCSGTNTIAVSIVPTPTISITGNTIICSGETVSLTASGANTYSWNTGPTSSSITVSPVANTIYTVTGYGANPNCMGTNTIAISVSPIPTVTVSGNLLICLGETASLTAGGANTYSWNTGPTSASMTVSPIANSIYTVTGYGNNPNCMSTTTVVVLVSPIPTVTIAGNTIICLGQTANLTAAGANTYSWSNGSPSQMISVSPISNSIYTVTGYAINPSCFGTSTIAVSVLPLPDVAIFGETEICAGASVTLNATGANSYTWSTASTNNSISVSPTATTIYTVVGINASTGCSNLSSTTVHVGAIPQLSADNASVCAGQTVTLGASGAVTYTWSTGANTSSTTVSPGANAIYTVSGSGNMAFCIGSKTVAVTVIPTPVLTVTSSAAKVCEGRSVTLSAGGADAYTWSNGSFNNTISVAPSVTSNYTVIGTLLTIANCFSSKTIDVIVEPLPAISILFDSLVCEGDPCVLTAQGASSYYWNNAQSSPSINVTMVDKQVYVVTGTDALTGCANTSSVELKASNSCCQFFIPNSFTPNEDGDNEVFGPVTQCHFKEYKFMIFNRWGQKIFETNDPKAYWDGTYKDKPSPKDIYVYVIEAEKTGKGFTADEKYIRKTGHVIIFK